MLHNWIIKHCQKIHIRNVRTLRTHIFSSEMSWVRSVRLPYGIVVPGTSDPGRFGLETFRTQDRSVLRHRSGTKMSMTLRTHITIPSVWYSSVILILSCLLSPEMSHNRQMSSLCLESPSEMRVREKYTTDGSILSVAWRSRARRHHINMLHCCNICPTECSISSCTVIILSTRNCYPGVAQR